MKLNTKKDHYSLKYNRILNPLFIAKLICFAEKYHKHQYYDLMTGK